MSTSFSFRGLMAPTFTAFNSDLSLNLAIIPEYAKYLKSKNINAVLVNGTSGEGMSMSVNERKLTAEKWVAAGKELGLEVMIQIGGAPYPDVVELAKHAETIGVKSVLCLPELYFKPKTEEALVDYLDSLSKFCPSVALLYYHIPLLTGLNFSMPRLCDLARKKIPTFAGIKYSSGDLEKIISLTESSDAIFIGSNLILMAVRALGFNSSIMTTLNILPEYAHKIVQAMDCGDVAEARRVQKLLNDEIFRITKNGSGDWVAAMKAEFNRVTPELHLGNVRI